MMRELMTLRDFLTEEELKFLPGRLVADTFILLKQNKSVKGEKGVTHFETPIQVFTNEGTYIGEITQPHWVPESL